MKFMHNMESMLIIVTSILCTLLLLNLFYKLRSVLLWRVNCWFCNNNLWTKFVKRNCWTCPTCEQYNGFTKDGDYNKPILTNSEQAMKTPKVFQISLPKNGLCKMCNINQQLKVAQLANFVPMNEKNFDNEIEIYRSQLEKAYKLCSPCKKVLQVKLHKEKEILLGSKLLQSRTPDENAPNLGKGNQKIANTINNMSMYIAGILLILVAIEFYKHIISDKHLLKTINNLKDILISFVDRLAIIVKMKMLMTFPVLETYFYDGNDILFDKYMPKTLIYYDINLNQVNELTQKILGGFVCLIQIVGHVWNINQLKYSIVIDLLWSVFVIMSTAHCYTAVAPMFNRLFKLACVSTLLLIYRIMKRKTARILVRPQTIPKTKLLSKGHVNSMMFDDDDTTLETDDDVSLSKFGLNHFTDSSDSVSPLNSSIVSGRCFTPRSNDNLWHKPKINTTFCVNSVVSKSPSSVSDTMFVKPSFKRYQKLSKDDSDSELDESISSLYIGGPRKSNSNKKNSIFSLRKFSASPNFITPAPLTRRPLISPSKLGHGTSWVAGGYWGSEGENHLFNLNSSRSSSQSSGFESQTSSVTQRNVFSQPSPRDESVYGEHTSLIFDRFRNCNTRNHLKQAAQNVPHASSPMFPQMQYNNHVHIPQPQPAQNLLGHTLYNPHTKYIHNSIFRSPNDCAMKQHVSSFSIQ